MWITRTLVAVGAVAVLAACGTTEGSTASSAEETSSSSKNSERPSLPKTSGAPRTTTTPTPTGPPMSPRGNIIAALGDEGILSDRTTGKAILTFSVDSIAPIECNSRFGSSYAPENGTIIGVQMRVSTAPELADTTAYFAVNPNDFVYVGADGLTVNNVATIATYACRESDSELLTSDQMMPGSQYAGLVILDVPAPNGTLIYLPSTSGGSGFEWTF